MVFLQPSNATHRQYEALRAYFAEGLSSAEAARRFGYTEGSFRVLCHQFRQDPKRSFFVSSAKGPQSAPKKDKLREQIVALRKQNLSIYDISLVLRDVGHKLSPAAVSMILKEEGFARLPRRGDDERLAGTRPRLLQLQMYVIWISLPDNVKPCSAASFFSCPTYVRSVSMRYSIRQAFQAPR